MSNYIMLKRFYKLVIFFCQLLLTAKVAIAQDPRIVDTPPGQNDKEDFILGYDKSYLIEFNSDNNIVVYDADDIFTFKPGKAKPALIWAPPEPYYIVQAGIKNGDPPIVLVMLDAQDEGRIYALEPVYGGVRPREVSRIGKDSTRRSFREIIGDDLYILSSDLIYVSRDSGATWQVDTVGLGGLFIRNIVIDTAQNVYAATSSGLYTQGKKDNVWIKHPTFPVSVSLSSIFVDRMNRIFIATNSNGVYRSLDGGVTWKHDTLDIGTLRIKKFTDDRQGAIYALDYQGIRLFRSLDAGLTWSRIESQIVNTSEDPSEVFIINDISGDSLLIAATKYGMFYSTNRGTDWQHELNGKGTTHAYGILNDRTGGLLVSTDLGVFHRNTGDTDWVKTYPQNGYVKGSPIWQDDSGNITITDNRQSGYITPSKKIMRSSDNGLNWAPDTAGLSIIPEMNVFYVDESGIQYIASRATGNRRAQLYKKTNGGQWSLDTIGFHSNGWSDAGIAFISDRHGKIFHSGQYTGVNVWSRLTADAKWEPDTLGLNGDTISNFAADRNGTVLASSITSGIYKYSGGIWEQLSMPFGLSGSTITSISVDSSNLLWIACTLNRISKGVYYTSDYGNTWTFAGADSIYIESLHSFGDTTYALSSRGILIMFQKPTSVPEDELINKPSDSILLNAYPNPFQNTTNIGYTLMKTGIITIKIYDTQGQLVRDLFSGVKDAGKHIAPWDGRTDAGNEVPNGVYIYRIQFEGETISGKMVLIR